MAEKEWYEGWFNSPFYHKLYFERDEEEARIFIGKLLTHLKPAAQSRMLDVACGKGRHSKTLASFGYQVTGIDISPDSINYAHQFENEHLQLFVHDMRLPFYSNYFNYAFNFFTSFGYFRTRREHDDAIRTIARSLKPSGVFVIDYLNVHWAEDRVIPSEDKVIDGTMYHIQRWNDEHHFYKRLVVEDKSLKAPIEYTEKVAKFTLGDFTEMFAYRGLQVQEVFGNYDFTAYDVRKTPRLIIFARK